MSLMTFLSELGCVLCGMFAIGIVWFINDNGENSPYLRGYRDGYHVYKTLSKLPPAQPAIDEWCTDCKEYDHEHHCCPRWNRVIRTTLNDMKGENNDTSLDN